jgi:hypothetical protein
MHIKFQTGFNVWKDSTGGSAIKPLASGASVEIHWNLVEGASNLVLNAAAAAAILTLAL